MNDRYGPPPASEDAISSLAERTLADGDDVIGKDCHVCMDEFKVHYKPGAPVYVEPRAASRRPYSTTALQHYNTRAACRPAMT
jgi:hypothetical protein